MSTYREAIFAVRSGASVARSGMTVRFLTPEEAEPIFLQKIPERRVVMGDDGKGPKIANGRIVVETIAPKKNPRSLGLYVIETMQEFHPSEEDIVSKDWEITATVEVLQKIQDVFSEKEATS